MFEMTWREVGTSNPPEHSCGNVCLCDIRTKYLRGLSVTSPSSAHRPIAIIGSGSIGVAWAIVFARAGWNVQVHDTDLERCAAAREDLSARLVDLDSYSLLKEDRENLLQRVTWDMNLSRCVGDA